MASFTTRVLLNGYPSAEDYENLHKAMNKRGFSRVIEGSDGKEYWLPHAEYNRVGNVSRSQVLEDAKGAAATVSSKYEVLVTESAGRTWYGLQPVTTAEATAN